MCDVVARDLGCFFAAAKAPHSIYLEYRRPIRFLDAFRRNVGTGARRISAERQYAPKQIMAVRIHAWRGLRYLTNTRNRGTISRWWITMERCLTRSGGMKALSRHIQSAFRGLEPGNWPRQAGLERRVSSDIMPPRSRRGG